MTNQPDHDHVDQRAQLLPEEQEVGSVDPQAQAEAILAESEARTLDPEGTQAESAQSIPVLPDPVDEG